MRDVLESQAESGLSVHKFCERERLAEPNFFTGDDPADDPPGAPENGDFNGDGLVDGLDDVTWAVHVGAGPSDGGAVGRQHLPIALRRRLGRQVGLPSLG